MSDRAILIVRYALLGSAILSLLQATLLFHAFQRRVFQPWFAMSERMGRPVPPIMRDERLHRAWPLLMTAVLTGMWWYTGTPAGIALLQRALR